MNCHDFREQFEDGRDLTQDAYSHLDECQGCEIFHGENLQLTQMISSLPSVEAPKNFEFGFKSKLAKSQLNKPLSPIWRTLRLILPFSAAVLIFGLVITNSNLFDTNESPQTAQDKSVIQMELVSENDTSKESHQEPKDILLVETNNGDGDTKASDKIEKEINKDQTKPNAEIAKSKTKQDFEKKPDDDDEIITKDILPENDSPKIFSKDSALTATKPINPPGINPEKKINKTQINPNTKSFTPQNILEQFGIGTVNQSNQLKVSSVVNGSIGARSGVRVGDIVTAIDGQLISSNSQTNRRVQGKSLTIRRGNKTLNITLRNN